MQPIAFQCHQYPVAKLAKLVTTTLDNHCAEWCFTIEHCRTAQSFGKLHCTGDDVCSRIIDQRDMLRADSDPDALEELPL